MHVFTWKDRAICILSYYPGTVHSLETHRAAAQPLKDSLEGVAFRLGHDFLPDWVQGWMGIRLMDQV